MNQDTGKPVNRTVFGRSKSTFGSIRNRLLALALGTTILAVAVIAIVAITSANNVRYIMQTTIAQSLRAQAEAYLVQINNTIAEQNDLILDRAARDVRTVAEAAATIYNNNPPPGFWIAEEHMFRGENGQYLNNTEDTSSVFVPIFKDIDGEVIRDIELGAYLDLTIEPVFNNNPNAAAIYLGTINEVTRYYPNIGLGELVPADFQVTQRPWYTTSLEGNVGTEAPIPIWSPIYLDATGLGQVTTVAIPVYTRGDQLVGVVGLDIVLDEISANIETARFLQTGYSFLVDQQGNTISFPEQGYLDFLNRPPEPDEVITDLMSDEAREVSSEFVSIVDRMTARESGFESIEIGGRELFIAFTPIVKTGWSLGSVVAAEDVLQSVTTLSQALTQTTQTMLFTRLLPAIGIVLIILIALILTWTRGLVKPIQELADVAGRIGAGQWDVPIPKTQIDEISLLANTISDMRDQLSESFQELEKRVAERTVDLEHRALQLQTSAEVVRAIASVRDLDDLLTGITRLISARFGFYHVGVFLTDNANQQVVLRAANSQGGQRMLARSHKLEIGQRGIVGTAAGTLEPHIAMDVDQDMVFYRNPDLPETRSEMALPLISGGNLLGVLDIQSKAEAAFVEEDIAVLQTLADQIAIAIENAQLFTENQQALEAIQRAYDVSSQEAWQRMLRTQPELGYRATTTGDPFTVRGEWAAEMQEARKTGEIVQPDDTTIALPIKIREQVTGVVKLRKPEEAGQWTYDEIDLMKTLCDRLSTAMESARLYEETRRRAERERLTSEITAKMRASNDPRIILQTAAKELRQALRADRAQLLLQSIQLAPDEAPLGNQSKSVKKQSEHTSEKPPNTEEIEPTNERSSPHSQTAET